MLETIKDTFQITKKDLHELVRDRLRIITFFIMPIFMMVLVGFIFPNQNSIKNIPIGIANQDKGEIGKNLQRTIKNLVVSEKTKAFVVKKYNNIDSIKEGIKKQEITGGIVIPSDFSEKLEKNEQSQMVIIEDQTNPQISALTTQTLRGTINGFSQYIGVQKVSVLIKETQTIQTAQRSISGNQQKTSTNFKVPSPSSIIMPIKVKLIGLIPGNPNYFEFVAPGIIAMVVMTAVLTGLAASVSREKEQGTLDGILIAPISRLSIILGKAFSQSVRGIVQGFIVLLLAIFLFGISIRGSILLVGLIVLLGIFSFVGLGILVSAAASEQETATQLLFMFQFPMLFLSGVFFPIQQMPKIMQNIAHALPLTYAVQALRKVMILGAGIGDIRQELFILLIFGAVTLIIAVPTFKRIITK